jgi:uncharacterized protein (TIGR02678 family)
MTADGRMSADDIRDAPSHRVARGVRDVDLADYQRVVRSLLAHPYVAPSETRRLASLRRWEGELRADLESLGRYRLEVSPTAAVLLRRPVVLDPYRPARSASASEKAFDPRRYAYLCLLLSSLLSSGVQVLLTTLARQLAEASYGIDGLGFDADERAHRTAFVDVVRVLESLGVLRLRDGSSADLDADALYDVDHEAVHVITPVQALRDMTSIQDRLAESFGESRDERRAQVRQRVLRMLVDRPVVLHSDLDDDERSWLQHNGARVAADLGRLTGMQVERRRDGIALIDVDGDASARTFPRGGSGPQLALLLADRLCTDEGASVTVPFPRLRDAGERLVAVLDAARRPAIPGATSDRMPEGVADPAPVHALPHEPADEVPAWTVDDLRHLVTVLLGRYPVRRELRDDPVEATRLALEELLALGLVRATTTADGVFCVVAVPAIARYRRPADPVVEDPTDQLDLFGGA